MYLSTHQYTIAPVHLKDAWPLCNFCTVNEYRLKSFFPFTLQENLTPDLSTLFVQKKVRQFEAREEFLYIAKDPKNKAIMGMVYIKEIDWVHGRAELAYCIGYQYEKKGLMSQIVQHAVHHAFQVLDLKTLIVLIYKTNRASIGVAEKCGFIWEKTVNSAYTPPGKPPLDMELYELKLN